MTPSKRKADFSRKIFFCSHSNPEINRLKCCNKIDTVCASVHVPFGFPVRKQIPPSLTFRRFSVGNCTLPGFFRSLGLSPQTEMSDQENSFIHEEENFENGDHIENGDMEADQSKCTDEAELAAMKARVREMEEEAEKLKQLQSEVDKQMSMGSPPNSTSSSSVHDELEVPNDTVEYDPSSCDYPEGGYPTDDNLLNLSIEEKKEADLRSIYVGNVDYGATAEELESHFHGCGSVNRVTILCNKFDGHPKGFAYIEFADKDSVQTAMAMDESLFRGRQIKVNPKRTNRPGISTTNRGGPRGRGRGRVSRGAAMYGGYRPVRRARSYRRGIYYPY
ncbi:hypothetical protein M8J75_000486 [Diaphorina citri]|nr:hypothetical protein M8J75_000486 [Diaphorina citri]